MAVAQSVIKIIMCLWRLFPPQAEAQLILLLLFLETCTTLRMAKWFIVIKSLVHVDTHHHFDILSMQTVDLDFLVSQGLDQIWANLSIITSLSWFFRVKSIRLLGRWNIIPNVWKMDLFWTQRLKISLLKARSRWCRNNCSLWSNSAHSVES